MQGGSSNVEDSCTANDSRSSRRSASNVVHDSASGSLPLLLNGSTHCGADLEAGGAAGEKTVKELLELDEVLPAEYFDEDFYQAFR